MSVKDEYETPQDLFVILNNEFNFIADACARQENTKCSIFFKDALKDDWVAELARHGHLGGAIFMNPPHSNIVDFLRKAWEASTTFKVVCLVPINIKTCRYMDFLDVNEGARYYRQWHEGLEFRDLSRRTNFAHPLVETSSPAFGSMVMIMNRVKKPGFFSCMGIRG